MTRDEKRTFYITIGAVILLVLYSITGQDWMLAISGGVLFPLLLLFVIFLLFRSFAVGQKLLSVHKNKGQLISPEILIEKEWRYLVECSSSGVDGFLNATNRLVVQRSFGILTSKERPFFVNSNQSTDDFVLIWKDSINWYTYIDHLFKMDEKFNENYKIGKLEDFPFKMKIQNEKLDTIIQQKFSALHSIYFLSNVSAKSELDYFVFFRINMNRAEIIGFLSEL
jgi:hypothetical protein